MTDQTYDDILGGGSESMSEAQPSDGGGSGWPMPNDWHLNKLKSDPSLADYFEMKFGPGSASKALGVGQTDTAKAVAPLIAKAAREQEASSAVGRIGEFWDNQAQEAKRAKSEGLLGGFGKLAEGDRKAAAESELSTAKAVEPVARGVADMYKEAAAGARGTAKSRLELAAGLFGSFSEDQTKRLNRAEKMASGEAPLPEQTWFRDKLDRLTQAVGDFFIAKPVEFAGIIGGQVIPGVDPANNVVTRFGKSIEDKAKELFPGDEARQFEFAGKVAEGLGSTLAFGGTGLAVRIMGAGEKGALAAIALSGAAGQVPDEFEKATKAIAAGDATEQDRFINMLANIGLGASEAIPFAPTFASKGSRGARAAIKRGGEQGVEEFAQEAGQQAGSNVAAQQTYDPNRDVYQGVLEGMMVAGISGAAGGAAMSRAVGRAEQADEKRRQEDERRRVAQSAASGQEPEGTGTTIQPQTAASGANSGQETASATDTRRMPAKLDDEGQPLPAGQGVVRGPRAPQPEDEAIARVKAALGDEQADIQPDSATEANAEFNARKERLRSMPSKSGDVVLDALNGREPDKKPDTSQSLFTKDARVETVEAVAKATGRDISPAAIKGIELSNRIEAGYNATGTEKHNAMSAMDRDVTSALRRMTPEQWDSLPRHVRDDLTERGLHTLRKGWPNVARAAGTEAETAVPDTDLEAELPALAADIDQFHADNGWQNDLDDLDTRAIARNMLKGMPVDEALETYFSERHTAQAYQRDGQAPAATTEPGRPVQESRGLPQVGGERAEPGRAQPASVDGNAGRATGSDEVTDEQRRAFASILAGTTKRGQWATEAKASPAQLTKLIDEAVKDGRIEMRNGAPWRTKKARTIPVELRQGPNRGGIIAGADRLTSNSVSSRVMRGEIPDPMRNYPVPNLPNTWGNVPPADLGPTRGRPTLPAATSIIDLAKKSGRLEIVHVGDKPADFSYRPGLDELVQRLQSEGFSTIVEARSFAKQVGIKETGKALDELIEQAVVDAARVIVNRGADPADVYADLVALYDRQPNLGVRTSTSVANQAYSTPMPLAYLASRLAGVADANTVYEPTAGNGALLIEADPSRQHVIANEIDPRRAAALARLGFETSSDDATTPAHSKSIKSGEPAGSVIMNPPFGAVREGGSSKTFDVNGWKTTQIDHAIALQGLEAMADNGRAVLILGGINATDIAERRKGYRGKAKREFFTRLYGRYNVVDHFTVSGDLYKKQGAGWPVDVVVIEGRGKSALALPAANPPAIYGSWDSLAEKLNGVDAGTVGQPTDTTAEAVGRPDGGNAGRVAPTTGSGAERLPAGSENEPVRVRGNGVGGQPTDAPAPAGNLDGDRAETDRDTRAVDLPPPPRQQRVKREAKGGQAPYEPVSDATSLDALIPVNMAGAARAALERVAAKHGSVDALVADRLGYPMDDAGLYVADASGKAIVDRDGQKIRPFSAEQVDAIAAAIDNAERGAAFILGDQTGIGKGRVVAGMLRYAMRQGMTPVLVTEKPDLYGDMYRDMLDIGIPEMLGREPNLFMTNTGESVPLDSTALEWKIERDAALDAGQKVPAKRGKFLTGGGPASSLALMQTIAGGQNIADIIFTTYDQMNTVKGATTPRRRFLEQIAPRAFIAFDESHNAGGASETGWKKKDATPNRATFARDLARTAKGVIFSSATYAKRPDVMDLYARTDMGAAVDDPKLLPELIQRGGVPMQQIVATMLSDAGQYMRRERSFDGVEYAIEGVPVNPDSYRQFSDAIRAIFKFDMAVKDVRSEIMQNELDAKGMAQSKDSGVGEGAAHSTAFASIMHNIINQMLLAIKAGPVAKRAVDSFVDGEKPVVALSSTMESFITDFAEAEGIAIGDAIDLTFGDVLRRYLTRTLRITIKPAEGEKEQVQIPLKDLPPGLQDQYAEAEALINSGTYDGMPISPIDWIRHQVSSAGMTIAEVTGRGTMIDYSQSPPRLVARPKTEQGPSGKRASIAAFNAGKLDALILNRSGSTGVSMHASEKFANQKRRRMILAQADPNIDTHLQMLGRVHRTGQVIAPAYSQVAAEIPAEARPTAVLMKKMASLNANTTGARGSVFMSDSVDIMNEIGDKVVVDVLAELPEIADELGDEVLKVDKASGLPTSEDAAKRVTGRLVLLDPVQQSELLDALQTAYKREVEQLDALGDNPLEAKTVDLQAQTVDSTVLKTRTGDGPFRDEVRIEEVSAKAQGRAMSMDDILGAVATALGIEKPAGQAPGALHTLWSGKGRDTAIAQIQAIEKQANAWITGEVAKVSDETKAKTEARLDAQLARWMETAKIAYVGSRVSIGMPAGDLDGIVIAVEHTGRAQNPAALGSWSVKIAVPDGMRVVEFPMSKLFPPSTKMATGEKGATIARSGASFADLNDLFEDARKEGRETRYIVTGNILGGFESVSGKGRIVNYTTADGQLKPGVLMGRDFNVDKFMEKRAVRFQSGEQVATFVDKIGAGTQVKSSDGNVVLSKTYGGTYAVEVPASRAVGGRYFTEPSVMKAIAPAEFVKSGNKMIARIERRQFVRAVDAIRNIGALIETRTEQDVAQSIIDGSIARRGDAMFSFAGDRIEPTFNEPTIPADYGAYTRFKGVRNVIARQHARAIHEALFDTLAFDRGMQELFGDNRISRSDLREAAAAYTGHPITSRTKHGIELEMRRVFDMRKKDYALSVLSGLDPQLSGSNLDPTEDVVKDLARLKERLPEGVGMFVAPVLRIALDRGATVDASLAGDAETGRSMRRDLDALGYYSKLDEVLSSLGPKDKVTAATLQQKGVKLSEIEARGLKDALADGKAVPAGDLVKAAGKVELRERAYDRSPPNERELANLRRNTGSADDILARELGLGDDPSAPLDRTKWSAYSLDPSNPTYRETVIHLPEAQPEAMRRRMELDAIARERRLTPEEKAELKTLPSLARRGERDPNFRSGHFDEPNIVGHMMTSMTKHEGKPVYTIDQIQSDWGQKLRDGGVRDEAKIAELRKRKAELEANVSALNEQAYQLIEKHDGEPGARKRIAQPARELGTSYGMRQEIPEGAPIFDAFKKNFQDIELVEAELRTAEAATPGHPLVNTTDQWTTTTLRRALKQAVDADAAYVAIPSGDTVLSYNPGDTKGMREFYGATKVRDAEKVALLERQMRDAKDRYEELAIQFNPKTDPQQRARTAKAEYERLRDEWAKEADAWNDTRIQGIVPKNLRNILTKIDPSVKPQIIDTLETPSKGAAGKGFTLFPITDKVKKSVMTEGQAMFSFGRTAEAEGLSLDAESALTHLGLDIGAARRLIAVSLSYGPDVALKTFTHEEIHALRAEGVIDKTQWNALSGVARKKPRAEEARRVIADMFESEKIDEDTRDRLLARAGQITYREIYQIDQRYKPFLLSSPTYKYALDEYGEAYAADWLEDKLIEEAVAHAAADWADGRSYGTKIDRVMQAIRDFLEAIENLFKGNGYTNVDQVFNSIWSGELAKQAKARQEAKDASTDAVRELMDEEDITAMAVRPNAMLSFAGQRARTADLDALAKAKEMEAEGTDRTTIWTDTGWFKGVDGKWRFEIDDSGLTLNAPVRKGGYIGDANSTLGAGDIIGHPSLTEAYPELTSMPVRVEGGRYVGSHFWPGKTPETSAVVLGDYATYRPQWRGKTEMDPNEVLQNTNGDYTFRSAAGHELQHAIQSIDGELPPRGLGSGVRRTWPEVEARTVETRLNLTPDQRRARPPWLDYDVPEDQQIVRFANGESVSQLSYSAEPPVDGPAMRGQVMFAIRAFHGSPHDFDKFDLSKIGTGEGAQAYGHGLYFAESEGVAKSYRDKLTDGASFIRPDGSFWDPGGLRHLNVRVTARRDGIDAAIAKAKELSSPPYTPTTVLAGKDLADLEKLQATGGVKPNPGKMYEVSINAHPDDFLDWDKPLSQQSEKVRAALPSDLPQEINGQEAWQRFNSSQITPDVVSKVMPDFGGNIAKLAAWLSTNQAKKIGPQAASGVLRDKGVAGIKYLDQGSRDKAFRVDLETSRGPYNSDAPLTFSTREQAQSYADKKASEGFKTNIVDQGSRNYVVFDDNLIEIVAKDGVPVTKQERAEIIDAMNSGSPRSGGDVMASLAGGGSSLDMSPEARKARAEAMGFDTSRVWYQSELQPKTEFKPHGQFMGRWGVSGISLTDNPEMASRYLDRYGDMGWIDGKPDQPFQKAVGAYYVKRGNYKTITKPIAQKLALGMPLPEGYTWPAELDGYDGVIVTDAINGKGKSVGHVDTSKKGAVVGQELILRDPSNIRSVNAAFDPEQADSSQLMASLRGFGGDPQPSLNKAISGLKDALGLTITQGLWGITVKQGDRSVRIRPGAQSRVGGMRLTKPKKTARGQFSRDTGVISIRQSRDITAIAHEGGHGLEMLLGAEMDGIKAAYSRELVDPISPDAPAPVLNPTGYSGVDLDIEEQTRLHEAVVAAILLRDAEAKLAPNADQSENLWSAVEMHNDRLRAELGAAELARLVGRKAADVYIADVMAAQQTGPEWSARDYIRQRYSETGAARPRTRSIPDTSALSEGFAKWFEKYIMDPEAAKLQAPQFVVAFEELIDSELPGVLSDLHEVQTTYADMMKQAPLARLAADIVSPGSKNAWDELAKDGSFENIIGKLSTAYNALIDDLNPIAKAVQRLLGIADRNGVRDAAGKPISLPVHANPYKLLRLFRDSYNRGRMWLEAGIADLGTKDVRGPSLRDALATAFGGTKADAWNKEAYDEFGAYLVSIRAVAEFDRLDAKRDRLAQIDGILAQAGTARPKRAQAVAQARDVLGRREDALIREQTRLTDARRELSTSETTLRNLQERMQAKSDDVLAAQMARDAALASRRQRELQVLQRDARIAVREYEQQRTDVEELDVGVTVIEAEIAQVKDRLSLAQARLEDLDTAVDALKRDRDRVEKMGASQDPTIQKRWFHEKAIADAEAKYNGTRGYGDFKAGAALVHEWTHRLLEVRRQAGFISQELFDELSKRKDWYVPLHRDMSDAGGDTVTFRNATSKKWSPFKKYDGSARAILNPLTVLSQEAYATAQQIAFNEAAGAMINLAERAGPGGGSIAERLSRSESAPANEQTFDRIKQTAIDLGIDPVDAHMMVQRMEQNFSDSDVSLIWSPENNGPVALPQIPYWQNGERQLIRLTDREYARDMFDAINGLGEMSNVLIDMAAAPSRWLRMGVTTHPNFILRNLLRDVPAAYIRAGVKPFVGHYEGLKILTNSSKEVKGTGLSREDFLRLANEAGIIVGGQNVASLSTAEKRSDVLDLRNAGPAGVGGNAKKVAKSVTGAAALGIGSIVGGAAGAIAAAPLGPFAMAAGAIAGSAAAGGVGALVGGSRLVHAVEAVETAGRLGIVATAYRRALMHNPSLTQVEAMQEATFVANDVYDWGRRGSTMMALNRLITFLNASIQGTESAVRGLSGAGDRGSAVARHLGIVLRQESGVELSADEQRDLADAYKTWMRMAAVTLFFLVLYAMMKDDPWYEDIKDGTKATHGWLKLSRLGAVIRHRIDQGAEIVGAKDQTDAAFLKMKEAMGFLGTEWAPQWLRQYMEMPDEIRIPKPFEWAVPGNIVEAIWDGLESRDPRVGERIKAMAWDVLAPPGLPQAVEWGVGIYSGYDVKQGRDIVPGRLKSLPPHLRFDAYSSQLAIDTAKTIYEFGGKVGMSPDSVPSPKMIDWVLSQGAYWGKDIGNAYGNAKKIVGQSNREAGTIYDVWGVAGVTGRGYRNSKSIEEFWKLGAQEGGKFVIAYKGYDDQLNKYGKPDEANAYLARLAPEERAYAILFEHFKGADERNHPLKRAEQVYTINRDLRKDMILDNLVEKNRKGQRDFETKIVLSPAKQTEIRDILERLDVIEVRNAMVLLDRPGWKGRGYLDPQPVLDELKASDSRVYGLLEQRRDNARVADWPAIQRGWPKNRERLLRDGENAALE